MANKVADITNQENEETAKELIRTRELSRIVKEFLSNTAKRKA